MVSSPAPEKTARRQPAIRFDVRAIFESQPVRGERAVDGGIDGERDDQGSVVSCEAVPATAPRAQLSARD